MMTPDRELPRFNDCAVFDVPMEMAKAAELFPDRKDFLWCATDGAKGTPPTTRSHRFAYAGYAAMRTGWDRAATVVYFDGGPAGRAHIHQDKLSVLLWSYGKEIIFDAGGGMYDNSRFREYDVSTFAHNTVLVDGLGQCRPRSPETWGPVDGAWQAMMHSITCPGRTKRITVAKGIGRPGTQGECCSSSRTSSWWPIR